MSELKSVYIDRTGDWVRSGNDTGKFYLKSEADAEIESLKASHYAEMVDAGMRERRLRRALWLILADLHSNKAQEYANESLCAGMWLDDNDEKQCIRKEKCASRCRAKAEEYK